MIYEITDPVERIYRFLLSNNLVRSAADFSRMMGRSRTYHNTLRLQHRTPSPEAWDNLSLGLHRLLGQPIHCETRMVIRQFISEIRDRQISGEVLP